MQTKDFLKFSANVKDGLKRNLSIYIYLHKPESLSFRYQEILLSMFYYKVIYSGTQYIG